MSLIGLILIAYLIGAIPTALIAGKLIKGIDIRKVGSGNVGATNTWRALGWKAGVAVLVIDLGKGLIAATLIPRIPLGPLPLGAPETAVLCGLAAVIGHVFPVYIGFRGGKGVATTTGMLIGVAPLPLGIAAGVFALALVLTGRVSIGSLLGAVSVPIAIGLFNHYGIGTYPPLLLGLTSGLAAFILFTHRSNISRILRGEERPLIKPLLSRKSDRR